MNKLSDTAIKKESERLVNLLESFCKKDEYYNKIQFKINDLLEAKALKEKIESNEYFYDKKQFSYDSSITKYVFNHKKYEKCLEFFNTWKAKKELLILKITDEQSKKKQNTQKIEKIKEQIIKGNDDFDNLNHIFFVKELTNAYDFSHNGKDTKELLQLETEKQNIIKSIAKGIVSFETNLNPDLLDIANLKKSCENIFPNPKFKPLDYIIYAMQSLNKRVEAKRQVIAEQNENLEF